MRQERDYVMRMLPHRDPMLLVDAVEEMVPEKSIRTTFFVSPDREIFRGHFPGEPILPGVYTVECMAQSASILAEEMPQYQGKTPLFYGIDGVRLRRKIVPGETIETDIELLEENIERAMLRFQVTAAVGGQKAAEGVLTIAMR